ncbi:MAG: hypothetical protein M3323_00575 [Actinomycetota bacterium]|nr:hypothetical protein [Actinomycetota bacterium]
MVVGLTIAMWDVHTVKLRPLLLAQQVAFMIAAVAPFAIALNRIKRPGVSLAAIALATALTLVLYLSFAWSGSSTAGLLLGLAAVADYAIVAVGAGIDWVLRRPS